MSIADKFEVIADEVFEAGKKAEHAGLWGVLQNNGNRTSYAYMFQNGNWTDSIFNPEWDLVGSSFYRSWYGNTSIQTIPKTIDCRNPASNNGVQQMFRGATKLETISKILCDNSSSTSWSGTFESCPSLKNVIFDENSVIGSSIDFSACPLSVASMKSIINALADYSETNNGVYTVSFNSARWSALEADSTAPDGGTWKNYVETVKGWSY